MPRTRRIIYPRSASAISTHRRYWPRELGSMHGYDVIDHSRINPELGGEVGFRELAGLSKRETSASSLISFPIIWRSERPTIFGGWTFCSAAQQAPSPARSTSIGTRPVLRGRWWRRSSTGPRGSLLSVGVLHLASDGGGWAFKYFDHRFPLRRQDQDLDWSTASHAELYELLQHQHFALLNWRDADAKINWRRFFDITDLAAIRVAEPRGIPRSACKDFQFVCGRTDRRRTGRPYRWSGRSYGLLHPAAYGPGGIAPWRIRGCRKDLGRRRGTSGLAGGWDHRLRRDERAVLRFCTEMTKALWRPSGRVSAVATALLKKKRPPRALSCWRRSLSRNLPQPAVPSKNYFLDRQFGRRCSKSSHICGATAVMRPAGPAAPALERDSKARCAPLAPSIRI